MRILTIVAWLWGVLALLPHELTAQATENFRFSHLTVEEGLSDGMVYDALMDSRGFMWIATNSGLDRYDGYTFKHYRYNKEDSTSISARTVMSLMEDPQGYIWIGTIGGCLNRFDPETETFRSYDYIIRDTYSEGKDVTSLIQDETGLIWMGTFGCGFQSFDPQTGKFKRYDLLTDYNNSSEAFYRNTVHYLLEDLEDTNRLWIAANLGLYVFNKTTEELKRVPFYLNGKMDTLSTANRLYMDQPGELWVGSWGMGLGRLNIETGDWNFYIPDLEALENRNYFVNVVKDIERKSTNELWVCTDNQGLQIFDIQQKAFRQVVHDPTEPTSILTDKVNGIYTDRQNRNWIFNTNSGISILDPVNQSFQLTKFDPSTFCGEQEAEVIDFSVDPRNGDLYLTSVGCEYLFVFNREKELLYRAPLNPHLAASEDRFTPLVATDGKVWVAGGMVNAESSSLFWLDKKARQLVTFDHPLLEQVPIHNYKLTDILQDEKGNIWLATISGGLIRLNLEKNEVEQFIKSDQHPDYIDTRNHLSEIKIGKDGLIWIATLEEGVFSFDPKRKKFRHFPPSTENSEGLVGERVVTLAEDRLGRIWVGYASVGIQVIDPRKQEDWIVQSFTSKNVLPNENVWRIIRDDRGDMWVGTLYGLYRYNYDQNNFVQYTQADGIRDPMLGRKGVAIGEDGEILVGQFNGFYAFAPDKLYRNLVSPPLAFTSFNVLGKDFPIARDPNYVDKIQLLHDQNFFTIGFAALNFTQSEKNRYSFMLEGYDGDWITNNTGRNFANYTKVPPGTYTFRLRGSNNEQVWNNEDIQLEIEVLPPLWKTWWAYLLYGLAIGGILLSIYRFQRKRRLAQREAERLKELNELKTKLYNNITHEFRTPLTVVLGYLNRALRHRRGLQTSELSMMKQNSEQLLGLINQMLDLGKLDAGAMRSDAQWEDPNALLEYLTYSFKTLASEKEIELKFESRIPEYRAYLDKQKILMILSNLLSNAIKFTEKGGTIIVEANLEDRLLPEGGEGTNKEPEQNLLLRVRDTGIGISKRHLPHIFDRFYQVGDGHKETVSEALAKPVSGTGIGLALTKELVELLGGTIGVRSEKGIGTTFDLKIPVHLQKTVILEEKRQQDGKERPILLLVEDNPSLINYVSAGLSNNYQLIIATNGREGLEKAQEAIPDIIVSDIMMPEMDGYELCEKN